MPRTPVPRTATITYLALVAALSTPLYVVIARNGGAEAGGSSYVPALMWAPGIAALATTWWTRGNLKGLGWGLGKARYLVVGYLTPLLYGLAVYAAIWALDLGAFDASRIDTSLGRFVINNLTVSVIMGALFALGEEIGWRGLLAAQLARRYSFAATSLISGVIWGLWHVPLIVGSGGYNSGAPTWVALPCFMVAIVGLSFAFTWLRLASGSVWPAVVMHAVHNVFIQEVLDVMTKDTGHTNYFATEFGLGLAIAGIIVALSFWRLSQRTLVLEP